MNENTKVHKTECSPTPSEVDRRLRAIANVKSRVQIAALRLVRSNRVATAYKTDRLLALEALAEKPPLGEWAFPYPFLDKDDFLLYLADTLSLNFESLKDLDRVHNREDGTMTNAFYMEAFTADAVENLPHYFDD